MSGWSSERLNRAYTEVYAELEKYTEHSDPYVYAAVKAALDAIEFADVEVADHYA